MTPEEEKRYKDLVKILGKAKSEMEEWYDLQNKINSGLDGYIESIKDVSKLNSDIKNINKQINELSKDNSKISKKRIAYLELEKKRIEKNRDLIKDAIKDAKKWDMAIGAAGASTVKAISNLDKVPSFITGKLGLLKGMFEMDKAIRTTVTQMGVLGKQADIVRTNIKGAALNTISFGAGIKEIAEIQAQYTETLGRNVILNQKSLETIAEMGKATGLGLEGATEMSAEFDRMGVSAEKTGMFVQKTLDESSAMGLNATKVMKNIAGNIKMLNRYRFKNGVKGLVEMAKLATKLGVEVDFAASMADKLWNIEGAVEMSAQLNVMGGAWAQMADPFKLMYQARNDVKGLTENIAKAAAASMSFAQDGSIELNALEMHRLKIIAEQTGLEYEKLVEMGKTQFKMNRINMQVNGSDEFKEFIANTAEFKDGKAYIQLDSGKKLVSLLTETDRNALQRQIDEKKKMKARAEAAQSFDEKFQNLINMIEITMLPIVEGLTEALDPLVKDLMGPNSEFKKDLKTLGESLGRLVNWGAKHLASFVDKILDIFSPTGLFLTYLGGKILFNALQWFGNGLALAKGFLMGTKGFGSMFGGPGGKGGPATTGRGKNPIDPATGRPRRGRPPKGGFQPPKTSGFKNLIKGGGKAAFPLALAGVGMDTYQNLTDENLGTGEALAKTLDQNKFMAIGAGIGAMFGGVGAIPGAGIGAIVDWVVDLTAGDKGLVGNYGVEDGLFEGSNKNRRAILQNGKITPIDKKDDLLALKKYGLVDKAMSSGGNNLSTSKIELGDLNITGEIKITLPGGTQIGQEIMKSQEFRTSITRIVTSQLDKNRNGGKN
jgi:hypothetical protein